MYREDLATITPEEQARRSRHSWPTMTRSSVSVSGWKPKRTSISGMSELTAQWKQAMLTLPPSVLRDLAVEIQKLEVVTNAANQQLSAAGVLPNARQIIGRVFGCFPRPGAELVSPFLAVRTRSVSER